jgi:putative peptidoglycan lipid II flippase
MIVFGPGLVFFTVQYVLLRGFYAMELNKAVFWMQCLVAAVNIAAAVLLVRRVTPEHTAPALAAAYGLAYLVGCVNAYSRLDRRIGPLRTPVLVRFLVRLVLVTAVATAVAWLTSYGIDRVWPNRTWLQAAIKDVVVGGVDVVFLFLGARALHITELTSLVSSLTARLRRA